MSNASFWPRIDSLAQTIITLTRREVAVQNRGKLELILNTTRSSIFSNIFRETPCKQADTTRAFPRPGTGLLSGPGRGFMFFSGLWVLTGPGLHIQQHLEGPEIRFYSTLVRFYDLSQV